MNAHGLNEGSMEMADTMKSTAQSVVSNVRRGLGERLDAAKRGITEAQHAAESYVKGNPWKSLGASLLVGYVVGMLCKPR